jgi:hypothetical protein
MRIENPRAKGAVMFYGPSSLSGLLALSKQAIKAYGTKQICVISFSA